MAILATDWSARACNHADVTTYFTRDRPPAHPCAPAEAAAARSRRQAIDAEQHLDGLPEYLGEGVAPVYTNGEMRQMTDRLGCAHGINDSGQATGFAYFGANTMPDAFLYENGVLKSISALPGYSNQPYAIGYGINSDVAGAGALGVGSGPISAAAAGADAATASQLPVSGASPIVF